MTLLYNLLMNNKIYQNPNKFNKEQWEDLKERIIAYVEDQSYGDLEINKAEIEIRRKLKKIKKNTETSLKDIFASEDYSSPNWFNEQMKIFADKININNIKHEELFPIIVNNFDAPDFIEIIDTKPYVDNGTIKELLLSEFPWASDTISDYVDLKCMFNLNKFINATDTLLMKMIFKESYSLIDRLRQEVAIELSRKVTGGSGLFTHKENKEFIKEWYKYYPQDMIMNGNPLLLSTAIPYFTQFDVDEEGWITFQYDDLDKVISPVTNHFHRMLRDERNSFEHSYPTDFTQVFIEQGTLNGNETWEENRRKLCGHWQAQYHLSTILLIYHFIKLDELYKLNLQ